MELQPALSSVPAVAPGMVYVAEGRFRFGPRNAERYCPAFYIDRHPVTNAEYLAAAAEFGLRIPAHLRSEVFARAKARHPVVGLRFDEAQSFARRGGFDLPTEEEWEKAARGTEGRVFPWGDRFDPSRCNTRASGRFDTSPVDQYPQGASPVGALDMVGNVWEWTTTADSLGLVRVKGGSWQDPPAVARADRALTARPEFVCSSIGFRRVVRPDDPPPPFEGDPPAPLPSSRLEALEVGADALSLFEWKADGAAAAVACASQTARAWQDSLDPRTIQGALASIEPEGAELLLESARALESALSRGDLAGARLLLSALERMGASFVGLESARAAVAHAEGVAGTRPPAPPRRPDPRRRWLLLTIALALANAGIFLARASGKL
jgi:sulfatase-modifying factor enzyme 1